MKKYHHSAQYKDCATVEQLNNIESKHFNGCYYCGYTGR